MACHTIPIDSNHSSVRNPRRELRSSAPIRRDNDPPDSWSNEIEPTHTFLLNYHQSRVLDALNTYPVRPSKFSFHPCDARKKVSKNIRISKPVRPKNQPKNLLLWRWWRTIVFVPLCTLFFLLFFFHPSNSNRTISKKVSHETLFRSILSFGSWYPWKSSNEGKLK